MEDFSFSGRSKRPPKDPLNSLLSFGYTLCYEIIPLLLIRGLAFLDLCMVENGHPALASDLMEEWRPLIVVPYAKAVNGGTFKPADFELTATAVVFFES